MNTFINIEEGINVSITDLKVNNISAVKLVLSISATNLKLNNIDISFALLYQIGELSSTEFISIDNFNITQLIVPEYAKVAALDLLTPFAQISNLHVYSLQGTTNNFAFLNSQGNQTATTTTTPLNNNLIITNSSFEQMSGFDNLFLLYTNFTGNNLQFNNISSTRTIINTYSKFILENSQFYLCTLTSDYTFIVIKTQKNPYDIQLTNVNFDEIIATSVINNTLSTILLDYCIFSNIVVTDNVVSSLFDDYFNITNTQFINTQSYFGNSPCIIATCNVATCSPKLSVINTTFTGILGKRNFFLPPTIYVKIYSN